MKKWISLICMLCFIGLAGCQEEMEKTQLPEPNTQIETSKIIEPEEPVKAEPIVINLVHPYTSEVMHTFFPKDFGYEENMKTYKKNIEQFAKELARGTEKKIGYDRRMVLDRLDDNGQIIKGSPMVVLKESELIEKILAVTAMGGNVKMPLKVIESSYNEEDLPYLDDVLVSSYTTYFTTEDVGRINNIELSAKAINNVIVGSGDYFSFNTMVGPRDEVSGYMPAPEIINKKLTMGIGGGICQTSSTLFNAVDQVPIHVIERHHHSLHVGYVPKGRDATVSYDALDFRFQNKSAAPFILKAIYGKGFLTVEVRTSAKYKGTL